MGSTDERPVVFVARGDSGAEALVAALRVRGVRVEESSVGRPYFTYAAVGRQIDRSGVVVVVMDGPTAPISTLYELSLAAGLADRMGREPRPTYIYGRRSDELDEQLHFACGEDRLPTFLPDDLDAAAAVVLAAASGQTA